MKEWALVDKSKLTRLEDISRKHMNNLESLPVKGDSGSIATDYDDATSKIPDSLDVAVSPLPAVDSALGSSELKKDTEEPAELLSQADLAAVGTAALVEKAVESTDIQTVSEKVEKKDITGKKVKKQRTGSTKVAESKFARKHTTGETILDRWLDF